MRELNPNVNGVVKFPAELKGSKKFWTGKVGRPLTTGCCFDSSTMNGTLMIGALTALLPLVSR